MPSYANPPSPVSSGHKSRGCVEPRPRPEALDESINVWCLGGGGILFFHVVVPSSAMSWICRVLHKQDDLLLFCLQTRQIATSLGAVVVQGKNQPQRAIGTRAAEEKKKKNQIRVD